MSTIKEWRERLERERSAERRSNEKKVREIIRSVMHDHPPPYCVWKEDAEQIFVDHWLSKGALPPGNFAHDVFSEGMKLAAVEIK